MNIRKPTDYTTLFAALDAAVAAQLPQLVDLGIKIFGKHSVYLRSFCWGRAASEMYCAHCFRAFRPYVCRPLMACLRPPLLPFGD